jgi:mRNA-degrading endonuclease RelE of RelBE toxin-antitoxin system
MNKIVFTKVCVDDIQYLKRCNKVQLLSKLKEILNFLKNNNPPYKTYKAEKFPQKSQFQGC